MVSVTTVRHFLRVRAQSLNYCTDVADASFEKNVHFIFWVAFSIIWGPGQHPFPCSWTEKRTLAKASFCCLLFQNTYRNKAILSPILSRLTARISGSLITRATSLIHHIDITQYFSIGKNSSVLSGIESHGNSTYPILPHGRMLKKLHSKWWLYCTSDIIES